MRGSGQRLPITLRFTRVLGTFSHTTCFPFSCALWACFSDRSVSGERSEPIGAPMPHAALCVVQPPLYTEDPLDYVFQCRTRLCGWCSGNGGFTECMIFVVSMPHAALWVVQQSSGSTPNSSERCFNAARGFVGGAATSSFTHVRAVGGFNAACGFVGGAAETLGEELVQKLLFQCRTRLCGWCNRVEGGSYELQRYVSMPHAALWVVQLVIVVGIQLGHRRFNAARSYSLSPPPPLRGPPPPLAQGRLGYAPFSRRITQY